MVVDSPSPPSLLLELARLGVKLKLDGDGRIEVRAPRGRLSAELRDRISRHKPELLEWLLLSAGSGPATTELPMVLPDPGNLFEPFPPSDLQLSFLIGSRAGLEYYVRPHNYVELDFDELDPARFEKALNQALRRQCANVVVVREDMLLETVRDVTPLRLPVSDLRGQPLERAQEGIEQTRAAMLGKQLPLDRWPWLDIRISLYGAGRARLHYHINSFFNDGPSTIGLFGDALHYYERPQEGLPELQVSYRDCVLALAELEKSPLGAASEKYWRDRMPDWPTAPALPLVAGSDARERSRLGRREFTLPAQLWAAFQEKATNRGLTPTNALYGAYAELIAYWSGSRHFLLNNMVTHRSAIHPQMGAIMGNFASLYPLEVDWRHDEPFHERVRRLQSRVIADMQHVYWSGVKVLQTLNQVRRTPGRAACPFVVACGLFVGQLPRPVFGMLETPQVLLDCGLWEIHGGSLWVVWDLYEAMFPDGLVEAMMTGFHALLTRLADDDAAWESTAPDLLPADQRVQRAQLHRADLPAPSELLHERLPRRAAEFPDRPAMIVSDVTLTYSGLHERSYRLAELLRDRGVCPGDLVAVVVPEGAEQIPAVLGVLAAGAVYVPIDPGWPDDRIRYLLGDTDAAAVLATEALRSGLVAITGRPVLAVDGADATRVPTTWLPVTRHPEDLAYVIYTSGSTGRPKGVMLDHRGPVNTITDINRRFGIGPHDVLFGVSSLCFDLSVYDIFGALGAGATLVLPTASQAEPASWIDIVSTHGVTVWNSVPAVMQLFVEAAASAGIQFPSLRAVLLSGDWIPVQLPRRIREVAPNARVISLGGATEASIWSICFPVDNYDPDWVSIPYGTPLANQTWHVLDEVGRDAPTWCAGQLYIGGSGLALGYLGDEARTRAAFVRHPRTGERLYRTGDLGRYLPSGDIEFLGRADFQVKIQGFRVEPGEIEHALAEHPAVRQAAVVARAAGSGKQLAAFAVAEPGEAAPTEPALRAFLTARLPSYLVPSHIAVLDHLPLTANGKLDRRALEALGGPAEERVERTYTPARTPTEAALVDIWEEVLASSPIGVHDDFFDLGGQSFAALRVVGLVAQRLGRRVPLGALLERRTVAGLADLLDAPGAGWSPLVQLRPPNGRDPWFFVHPAGGDVLCYRGLADALSEPLYAFQAPGPATGLTPLDTVEDLAGLYLEALQQVRPAGPYLLGGWSSGAVVAFEMAHQLERAGEVVGQVVVIDAPAPLAGRDIDAAQALLWFLEDLDIGFDLRRVDPGEAALLAAVPEPEQLSRALDLARRQGVSDTHLDGPALAAPLAVFRGVISACNTYPAPTIAAGTTVVRARDGAVSEFAGHPCAGAPDWGWSRLTTGIVTTHTLPGTHHTLLTEHHVAAVAASIQGCVPAHDEEDA